MFGFGREGAGNKEGRDFVVPKDEPEIPERRAFLKQSGEAAAAFGIAAAAGNLNEVFAQTGQKRVRPRDAAPQEGGQEFERGYVDAQIVFRVHKSGGGQEGYVPETEVQNLQYALVAELGRKLEDRKRSRAGEQKSPTFNVSVETGQKKSDPVSIPDAGMVTNMDFYYSDPTTSSTETHSTTEAKVAKGVNTIVGVFGGRGGQIVTRPNAEISGKANERYYSTDHVVTARLKIGNQDEGLKQCRFKIRADQKQSWVASAGNYKTGYEYSLVEAVVDGRKITGFDVNLGTGNTPVVPSEKITGLALKTLLETSSAGRSLVLDIEGSAAHPKRKQSPQVQQIRPAPPSTSSNVPPGMVPMHGRVEQSAGGSEVLRPPEASSTKDRPAPQKLPVRRRN